MNMALMEVSLIHLGSVMEGQDCPLFAFRWPWRALARTWSKTISLWWNFGSKLRTTFLDAGILWWAWQEMAPHVYGILGWFNRWKEPIITRDPKNWSCSRKYWNKNINLTLHVPWWNKLWFHEWLLSSRNSGFATSHILRLWCLLDEKEIQLLNIAVKKMMATHFPEYPQLEHSTRAWIGSIPLVEKVSLFET